MALCCQGKLLRKNDCILETPKTSRPQSGGASLWLLCLAAPSMPFFSYCLFGHLSTSCFMWCTKAPAAPCVWPNGPRVKSRCRPVTDLLASGFVSQSPMISVESSQASLHLATSELPLKRDDPCSKSPSPSPHCETFSSPPAYAKGH